MGTATPTDLQITRIREDSGKLGPVYDNAQITDLWLRCQGASGEAIQHEATLALMARQLLFGVVTMRDYKTGTNSESMNQVWTHAQFLYNEFKGSLQLAQGTAKRGIMRGRLRRGKPPAELPNDFTFGEPMLGDNPDA